MRIAEAHARSERVYRRNEHRYVLAALYCAAAGFFVMFAYLVHPAFAIGCLPWLVLAYRTFRIGIFPSSEGVLVRNVLRSRRLSWDAVERFDWGDWWGFSIGGIYLQTGEFVRAFALNPPFELTAGIDKSVPRALAGLNEELAHARAVGTAPRGAGASGP